MGGCSLLGQLVLRGWQSRLLGPPLRLPSFPHPPPPPSPHPAPLHRPSFFAFPVHAPRTGWHAAHVVSAAAAGAGISAFGGACRWRWRPQCWRRPVPPFRLSRRALRKIRPAVARYWAARYNRFLPLLAGPKRRVGGPCTEGVVALLSCVFSLRRSPRAAPLRPLLPP